MGYSPNLDFLIPLAFDAGAPLLRLRYFSQFDIRKGGRPKIPAMEAVVDLVIDRMARQFPYVSIVTEHERHIVFESGITLYLGSFGDIPSIERLPTLSFAVVVDGVPESAVIYAPAGRHLWMAKRGSGCRSDGRLVSVSERGLFGGSSFYVPKSRLSRSVRNLSDGLADLKASIIDVGPIAYMGGMVASGMFEGVVFPAVGNPESPAIQLIVEEAGGVFSDLEGNDEIRHCRVSAEEFESTWYVASNGVLHDDFLYLIRASRSS